MDTVDVKRAAGEARPRLKAVTLGPQVVNYLRAERDRILVLLLTAAFGAIFLLVRFEVPNAYVMPEQAALFLSCLTLFVGAVLLSIVALRSAMGICTAVRLLMATGAECQADISDIEDAAALAYPATVVMGAGYVLLIAQAILPVFALG